MNASAGPRDERADAAGAASPVRPASARDAWVLAFVLAAASAVVRSAQGATLLPALSDETLLVPLARRAFDPALFPGDTWLAIAGEVFSHVYSWIFGAVLRVARDPVTAERLLAFPFHVVFLAGSHRVLGHLASRGAAWKGTLVLALVPHVLVAAGAAGPWPHDVAGGLPRDVVFALVPWIWLASRDARCASGVRRALLFVAVGASSVVHPLTAVHLVAWLVVADFALAPGVAAVRRAIRDGVCAGLGLAPYVIQWLAFPRTPGQAPREAVLWRVGGIGADSASLWTGRMETALWLCAAAWVLVVGATSGVRVDTQRTDTERTDTDRAARRPLVVAMLVAVALAALSPAFGAVVAGIQFDRLARVAVWAAVLVGAVALAGRPAPMRVAWAACLAAAAIGGPVAVRSTTGADRGPLEWVARRVEVRLGMTEAQTAEVVPSRPRVGDPSRSRAVADHFRALCEWVRMETPVGARFAVPPEDWSAFRAYADRGVVVTRKEGGFALSFLGGRGADWLREYREAVGVYAARDPARWAAWAADARFTYAVLDDAATPLPSGWVEARAFGPFRVVRAALK